MNFLELNIGQIGLVFDMLGVLGLFFYGPDY